MRVLGTVKDGEGVAVCLECDRVLVYTRKELPIEKRPFMGPCRVLKCPCGKEQIV